MLEQPSADRDGFHKPRSGQLPDTGTLAHAKAAPGAWPHATQCDANAKGWAGVLFTPSRCGGDRYKLRVFVDPTWLRTKADGVVHQASVTTGTLVLWRNIRLNRYVQMQTPNATRSTKLQEALEKGGNLDTADWKRDGFDQPVFTTSVIPGIAGDETQLAARPIDVVLAGGVEPVLGKLLMHRPVAVDPQPLETHLNYGYCELIADCDAVEAMSSTEREAATRAGITAFKEVKKWKTDANIDWDVLCWQDATSPFMFNLLNYEHYNDVIKETWKAGNVGKKPPFPPNVHKPIDTDMAEQFLFGFQTFAEAALEHFAGGGVLPGITVVQVPGGFTWDGGMAAPIERTITSGYGAACRAFWMAQTKLVYGRFIYPCISNFLHELGHVLGIAHQYDGGGFIKEAHQKVTEGPFVKTAPDEVVCVMSYTGCYGELCGECLLSLRGWKQLHVGATL